MREAVKQAQGRLSIFKVQVNCTNRIPDLVSALA